MTVETIERDFRDKVSAKVRLASEGVGRYRVFTPFMFEDGDHLAIVLRRHGQAWALADEGHTFMHLTYELEERSLHQGTRQTIITNALASFGVEDREGELVLPIPEERYGDALFSYVQALLKITDVTYLSRERVRSTFMEDFRALMADAVPEARRGFDWHDPQHDPQGHYPVDCRINGMARPLMVFALPGDDKAQVATISLLQFERWGLQFRSMAIFEDQEQVNRKVLARFSDVCEKQFSSLKPNEGRIRAFLEQGS